MSLLDALLLEEYRDPHVIWIAARTDRVKGSGTLADPFNGSSIPYPAISIQQLTSLGTVATAVSNGIHGFVDGDQVTISGVDVQFGTPTDQQWQDRSYVGTFPITRLSETSFSYQMVGEAYNATAVAATGGIQCWPEREQFDRVMRSALPNSLIMIGPGTFDTKGYSPSAIAGGWNPKVGQRILGSGMGLTTIRLVGVPAGPGGAFQTWAFGFLGTDRADGFELGDLTVDCQADGQPNPFCSCSALLIPTDGHHIRIRRVRAIHFGSLGPLETYIENFPFLIGGKDLVDARYEDCVAEWPSPNAAWNSTIFGQSGSWDGIKMYYSRASAVRNNYVNGQIVHGPMAWVKTISADNGDPSLITLTTKTPHGYSVPGNVSVQGVRIGGNPNNRFNGVFKIEALSQTELTYRVFPSNSALGEVDGDPDPPDPGTLIGAPVSPQPLPIEVTYDAAHTTDRKTFHVKIVNGKVPHNVTVNNRTGIGGVFLSDGTIVPIDPYDINGLNNCNGVFRVTNVQSKTEFDYTAEKEAGIAPGPGNKYVLSGPNPETAPVGHAFMGADNGTGAVLEGNKLLHGGTGGPWVDTASTLDLVARFNYYHDIEDGPNENGGDISTFPLRSVASLTHTGIIATCNTDGLGHNLVVGQVVRIDLAHVNGSPNNPFNGYHIVTSLLSTTSFTFQMASDPGADPDADPIPAFQPVAQIANRTIEKNIIELALGPLQGYRAEPTGIYMAVATSGGRDVAIPYVFRRALVRANLIRQMDWKRDGFHTGITLRNTEKVLADKNLLDVGYPHPLSFKKSVSPSFLNNRDPAGRLIRGYDEGSGRSANEIQTILEDVALLSL